MYPNMTGPSPAAHHYRWTGHRHGRYKAYYAAPVPSEPQAAFVVLYDCVKKARCHASVESISASQSRWEKLLSDEDDRRVWTVVLWKQYKKNPEENKKPSDQKFKIFFESSSNLTPSLQPNEITSAVFTPVLDEAITVNDVAD